VAVVLITKALNSSTLLSLPDRRIAVCDSLLCRYPVGKSRLAARIAPWTWAGNAQRPHFYPVRLIWISRCIPPTSDILATPLTRESSGTTPCLSGRTTR
jgi:hypothetical protein